VAAARWPVGRSFERDAVKKTPQQLADEARAGGDPAGWFDPLYRQADGDMAGVPWAQGAPHPLLDSWLTGAPHGAGRRALVVGCGLGDDAEALARHGFAVTAFDLSEEAIRWSRQRFPESEVEYRIENLLALPAEWRGHFTFILEIYTLQALPIDLRADAMTKLPGLLAPEGELLVICIGRDHDEPVDRVPWPLSREELGGLEAAGLALERFEEHHTEVGPRSRHFRLSYRRA
jgi:SAM-dependent methyltransferase